MIVIAYIAMLGALILWVIHMIQDYGAETTDDKLDAMDTQIGSVWMLALAIWNALIYLIDKVGK
jgi:hypothetical protein